MRHNRSVLSVFLLLGSISESENVSFRGELVTTANATNHVRASFRVEFARQSCCPVLYFTLDYDVTDALLVDSDSGAAGGGGGGDRKCFNDSMMTRSSFSDRHLWNLSDDVNNDDDDNNGDGGGGGDFRCVTCRRDDTIVCEGRFSKLHGYDAVGNFSVGYPCSDVKHLNAADYGPREKLLAPPSVHRHSLLLASGQDAAC